MSTDFRIHPGPPKFMLDKIVENLNLKSKKSIVETVSMLRRELYGKGFVVVIDNVHQLSKQAIETLEKIPIVIVASATYDIKRLRFREKVKLKRKTYEESKSIAKEFLEMPDYLISYIARRSNGLPGKIKILVDDIRIALELGEIELSDKKSTLRYLDKIKLPSFRRISINYILLALASLMLCLRYVFYRYNLYDVGYMVAILAYLIYTSQRLRKVKKD